MSRKATAARPTAAEQFQQFRDLLKLPEPRNRRSEHARERRYQAERDACYAVFSKLWPSHITPAEQNSLIHSEIVCIHSPAGQLAIGLPADRAHLFAHLERTASDWDGHSAAERVGRLRRLLDMLPAKSEGKIRKSDGNSRRRARRRTKE
jgi:hypothetical protein